MKDKIIKLLKGNKILTPLQISKLLKKPYNQVRNTLSELKGSNTITMYKIGNNYAISLNEKKKM